MRWAILSLLACAAAVSCWLVFLRNPGPSDVRKILDRAEQFELYSVSPEEGPLVEGGAMFHGYGVYGKTVVTNAAIRANLVAAIEASPKGSRSKCFAPRHAIRATSRGRTVDIVVCFFCKEAVAFLDGEQIVLRPTQSAEAS